ncbi:hypothetical protein MSAN_01968500 [Mycena sanguinolenta]|uniref:DUF6533 domain-containing protein n=1 Tax=Mycena sanguinolenta TaxID=230812 RepID=A0A8H7CPW3_9AGAR|nr:hypothetical protein MSAN_01968500 [Mycena sanguinolenta]
MESASVAAQFKALETALNHLTISHYASGNDFDRYINRELTLSYTVSSMCLYVYDFMLSFPDEVQYFWGARMSLVKVLFFCNRYAVLLLAGSKAFIIMQVRIYAMYNQNKVLKIILSTLFIMELVTEFSIAIPKLVSDNVTIVPIPGLQISTSFCDETVPKYFFAFPIPFMGFEFILFALASYKAYVHYREAPNKTWFGSRLVGVIFRDSILYFACGFTVNLLNVLVWAAGPYDLFTFGTAWGFTVPALAATHVLINMREIYNQSFDTTVNEDTIGTEFRVARRRVGWNASRSSECAGLIIIYTGPEDENRQQQYNVLIPSTLPQRKDSVF